MRLPASRALPASWIVPALAAAAWSGVMALAADAPTATQRSLVFLGGPLVLLSGLHARLYPFLHADERLRWLRLPIDPTRHWRAASRIHAPPFGVAAGLGAAALLLGLPATPSQRGVPVDVGLVVEFVWFAVIAGLLEPLASAAAAFLGRRFPDGSRAHELQRNLGGGWTTPEAVIHLYAPALSLGLAVLLAMPGQLSWERWLDGHALDPTLLAVALMPLGLALGLRAVAPGLYRRGLWETVPWLAEATRTLAGPPQPEPSPAWLRALGDPWAKIVLLQFWRSTSLPYLRLAIVLGLTIHTATRAIAPTGPSVAVAVAAAGAWIVPIGALVRDAPARARLGAALPIPARRRQGALGGVATLALLAPVVALTVAVFIRVMLD